MNSRQKSMTGPGAALLRVFRPSPVLELLYAPPYNNRILVDREPKIELASRAASKTIFAAMVNHMPNIRRIFAIFAILFFCLPAFAQRAGRAGGGRGAGAPNEGRGQAGPSLKIERDLEYARAGGQPLMLDLYYLEPLPTPRPVIVWIHGSGPGATKTASPATALISPTGVAVASIDYRTGTGVTLQMQLADAKAAIRW